MNLPPRPGRATQSHNKRLMPTVLCPNLFARHCEARSAVATQGSARAGAGSGGSWTATPQARLAMTNGSEHLSVGMRRFQTKPTQKKIGFTITMMTATTISTVGTSLATR